jgi:hypothetical protein
MTQPDIGERIMALPVDTPAYEHAYGAYGRGHKAAKLAAAALATTAMAEKEKEIERLREALQWIANVEPIKGLYHGGETYYGLNQRIKEHARQQLQAALGETREG